ncbi:BRWD3 [Cordylochernes scorpioides]|uniref:BRWD3 n=1 Tax=Cordylochernes scorpioides TaxID=51811 RepID=A0ABY6LHN4_9ARAC|nr:BRWD3 [Cordylochernes scorpioides]
MCLLLPSPGGVFLATGSTDHHIRVYHILGANGPEKILDVETHTDRVDSLIFSNLSSRFISGSKDGTALIWRYERGQWTNIVLKMATRLVNGYFIDHHMFHRSNPRCASHPVCSSEDAKLKLRVNMVFWNTDDSLVATSSSNHAIKIWNSYTGLLLSVLLVRLQAHDDEVYCLETHPLDPRILLSGGHDGRICVWDLTTGTAIKNYFNMVCLPLRPSGGLCQLTAGSRLKDKAMEPSLTASSLQMDSCLSPQTPMATSASMGMALMSHIKRYPLFVYYLVLCNLGVPDEVFFHTDYRPLIRDSNHHVLDEQTQCAPHLMPPAFLVDIDGNPYPPSIQRLVPGREGCADAQLVPYVASVAPGGASEVLEPVRVPTIDDMIERLQLEQAGSRPPPGSRRREGDVEGVRRQSTGFWQTRGGLGGCPRRSAAPVVRPLGSAQLKMAVQHRLNLAHSEVDHYVREMKRPPDPRQFLEPKLVQALPSLRKEERSQRRRSLHEKRIKKDSQESNAVVNIEEDSSSTSMDSQEDESFSSDDSDYSDWTAEQPIPPRPSRSRRVQAMAQSSTETRDDSTQRTRTTRRTGNITPPTSDPGPSTSTAVLVTHNGPGRDIRSHHSSWLTDVCPKKSPYVPQVGDEVVYFWQGHLQYVQAVRKAKLYEISLRSLPWKKKNHLRSLHPLLTLTQQFYCRIMSSQKRKRESITIEKKKEICQLARNNPTISKNEIGERFSLPRTTVRDILTQAEKWENYTVGSSKRQKVGKFSDLEDALFNWFTQKRANNIIITDDLLREKAKKLGEQLDVPENFAYSRGWLQRFKGRFHISQRRLCGEGASISPAIIDEHLTNLNSMLANSGYDPANIYNADETGLFFQLIPDRTLAHKDENCRGVKRMKQRITVLLCCNSTGTDKRRLLIIGKSAKPRCFRNFSPHFYCTYTSNSKAWMTSSIFQEWLLQFNKQLVSEGRRILLLLDNATSHCVPNDGLSNIKIHFLPPNMTASLQPLDSGIIKSFKAQYRKLQLQKMVELADAHLPTELRLDYAVRYCKMAWDSEAEINLTDDNLLVSTVTAKEELGEDDDTTVTQRPPSLREARTAAETVLLFLEHSKRATSDDVNLSADLLRRVYAISREKVNDDQHTGHPRSLRCEENKLKIKELIKSNRRISIKDLSSGTGLSVGLCHQIVTKDLDMIRTSSKFVPGILTEEQKEVRMDVCKNMVEMTRTDPEWMQKIITGDETWVYQYDPETKRQSSQWIERGEPKPKKARFTKFKWTSKSCLLQAHEVAKIVDIRFENSAPVKLCFVKLVLVNPCDEDYDTFSLRFHDMADVIDFIVLKQVYDQAIDRNWAPGECAPSSQLEGVDPKLVCSRGSLPCFNVTWDNGETEKMSPWDFEPVDEDRGCVELNQEERESLMYVPKNSEWSMYGQRADCRRIAAGLEKIMQLSIAEPFSVPVDLSVYPDYPNVVEYPMDLNTIKSRLENRYYRAVYYRRLEAIKFDIRFIETNALKFNQPNSAIVLKAKQVVNLVLSFIGRVDCDDPMVLYQSRQLSDEEDTEVDTGPEDNEGHPTLVGVVCPPSFFGSLTDAVRGQRSSRRLMHRSTAATAVDSESQYTSQSWKGQCQDLLARIWDCEDSTPFRRPVDMEAYPVSTPDCGTILE